MNCLRALLLVGTLSGGLQAAETVYRADFDKDMILREGKKVVFRPNGTFRQAKGKTNSGMQLGDSDKIIWHLGKLSGLDYGKIEFDFKSDVDWNDGKTRCLITIRDKKPDNYIQLNKLYMDGKNVIGGGIVSSDTEEKLYQAIANGNRRYDVEKWEKNKWYHVELQWSPEAFSLSVDGQKIIEGDLDVFPQFDTGVVLELGPKLNGIIDNLAFSFGAPEK